MTKIDFYILKSDQAADAESFACRLAEKAWRGNLPVLIAVDDQAQAQRLDQLLWTFREDSFLPHGPAGNGVPVAVSTENHPDYHAGLLINLRSRIPGWFSQFNRMSEIVTQDPEVLERSRKRFGHFRDRGYPVESHKL
ncbi:DNA polymerase III subunit chi [Biformimicrobium ophioploci]|uniref:DNA polymerase III subunit chi n=1 Tax=Biformimicrobium ophioploci TaxID=3036711 RepID=A0ABQ6LXI0_9GAMM|nr:DNA polymerase III subunit chi [Microbulbifer sp. NKW57]GMG86737.1 DNA polymerase III subunit chi [Microbulbifer sp. NKW57]